MSDYNSQLFKEYLKLKDLLNKQTKETERWKKAYRSLKKREEQKEIQKRISNEKYFEMMFGSKQNEFDR